MNFISSEDYLESAKRSEPIPYQRIATEEAFAPPEMIEIYRQILAKGDVDPGFKGLMGFYMSSPSARAAHHAQPAKKSQIGF